MPHTLNSHIAVVALIFAMVALGARKHKMSKSILQHVVDRSNDKKLKREVALRIPEQPCRVRCIKLKQYGEVKVPAFIIIGQTQIAIRTFLSSGAWTRQQEAI